MIPGATGLANPIKLLSVVLLLRAYAQTSKVTAMNQPVVML